MMKKKINIANVMPVIILVALFAVFAVITRGEILKRSNLLAIVNQSVATIIAGLGMMFVISLGGTDITAGSLVALAGTLAAMAGSSLGFGFAWLAAIGVGIASGLFLGIVNTKFKVSSFMASLAMLMALRALVNWILNSRVVMASKAIRALDGFEYKIPILIVLILIIGYVFKFTPFGYYCRAIGENENAMKFIGIPVSRIKIFAFIISGVMASIAGIFAVARVGGASNTMGASFEMRVMMAMFIASIPVSGGSGTKIYKLIIGAFTILILESGLTFCGASGAVTQGIRGLVLMAVVYLTQVLKDSSESGRLSRTKERAAQAPAK